MEDYYKILGLRRNASKEEIKRAYRLLAHKFHPDKKGGDEEQFKKINEAYQVLGNDEKRRQYDQFGRVFSEGFPGRGGAPGQGGFEWDFDLGGIDDLGDLEEIFSAFFEGLGVRQKRRTYRRGGDVEVTIDVSLLEAQKGKVVDIVFNTYVVCETCKGAGHEPGVGMKACEYCDGRGEIRETRSTFFGNFARVAVCEKCKGAGKVPEEVCKTCGGAGRVKGKRDVSVEVRPGVQDGQIIKVAGMGEAGEHQAGMGDLYVRIHVKPNSVFERRGNDLYRVVPVKITDVLLGRSVKVGTLDGRMVELEVPRGFHLSETLRIKGEGMPPDGDMVVKLRVETPKRLSAKAKKLLEDLDEELG